MIDLMSMSAQELFEFCAQEKYPAFRAKQLYSWLRRGADFSEMTNLPGAMREQLARKAVAVPVKIIQERRSARGDTEKYLYELADGNCIEGVLMHNRHGDSLCISTQVGCRMGCRFCASTLEGCVRNLSAGEILGQYTAVERRMKAINPDARISNIVLMGSGEPLDNYDEVVKFLRHMTEPAFGGISIRSISLSTCGLVERMKQFAKEGLPVTLSLSMHAPNDSVRKQLMPIANRYTLEETLDACRFYIEKTGRRVILEYAMVHGVNCSVKDADEIANRLRGMQAHVNLIPLNDVPERGLRGAERHEAETFQRRLELRHISVTRRRSMGEDIEGACGQLRRSVSQKTEESK